MAVAVVLVAVLAAATSSIVHNFLEVAGPPTTLTRAEPALPNQVRVSIPGMRMTDDHGVPRSPRLHLSRDVVGMHQGDDLVAFSLRDGSSRWQAPCAPPRSFLPSPPFGAGDHLLVNCGWTTTVLANETGATEATLPSDVHLGIEGEITVVKTPLALVIGRQAPVVGDTATSEASIAAEDVLWSVPMRGIGPFGMDADRVYVIRTGEIVALHQSSGALAWASGIYTEHAVLGPWGILTVTKIGDVQLLDIATGKVVSSFRLGTGLDRARPVAMVDEVAVILDPGVGLLGFDTTTGSVRWTMPSDGKSPPQVVGRFVVANDGGGVIIARAVDGEIVVTGGVMGSAVVTGYGHAVWMEPENTLVIQPLP